MCGQEIRKDLVVHLNFAIYFGLFSNKFLNTTKHLGSKSRQKERTVIQGFLSSPKNPWFSCQKDGFTCNNATSRKIVRKNTLRRVSWRNILVLASYFWKFEIYIYHLDCC
jgi:hypothetical protein